MNKLTIVSALALFVAAGAVVTTTNAAPAGCNDQTGGNVLVVIAGTQTGFNPRCILISSGATATWSNADIAPHDPGETLSANDQDGDECFRFRDLFGRNQNAGDQYPVTFTFDGTTLKATDADGEEVCENFTVDAAGDAVMPYHCYVHPTFPAMRGHVAVRPNA